MMDIMRICIKPGCRFRRVIPQLPYRKYGIRDPEAGFTFLELLVAIFIFAIIATTIFGSYNSVFSSAADIKADMMASEMAKNCLNRMASDLQSMVISLPPAYSPTQGDQEPDPYRLLGEVTASGGTPFARLRFASLAHLPLGETKQSGIAEIIYSVRSTRDGDNTLRRSDELILYGPAEEKETDPILCENLKALTFRYYGTDGEEHDIWDSESEDLGYSTPRAIGIKLAIGNDEKIQEFETLVKLPLFRKIIEQ
jgi:general secretion pathway protein J